MIWIKAFHVIFMVAWFAGLFYLPRLYINHVQAEEDEVKQRLAQMQFRLYRFITPWMALTVIFGLWLLVDYGWSAFSHSHWLMAKLALVAVLIVYHFYCGKILRQLAQNQFNRSHVWLRWFNEFPVLILFAIVILVVVKPF